ncbi:MAG: tRNA pseudouridine synthase B [Gammaproteobacteria bacterium]|nr:tRNA pseudouridine synthase B [Gammaproteobacteria bacterium]
MGRRHRPVRGRDIHGILLLDKPAGLTSNEALQRVKQLFNARKAGHTGSLDKMATGLLPICFGDATKFTSFLLESDKSYLATFKLGVETATGDALGEVLKLLPVAAYSIEQIESALQKFRGPIEQIPPMFSALKKDGKRLYELAYQGIEIERDPRPVTIYNITLLRHERESLELAISCSKGTYIRTLSADIGRELGCGAHVAVLRRTGAGPFTEQQMTGLPDLENMALTNPPALEEKLFGIDAALANLPEVRLASSISDYLCDGQAVIIPRAPTSGMLRLYTELGDFIGVGEVLEDGRVTPRRLVIHANRGK